MLYVHNVSKLKPVWNLVLNQLCKVKSIFWVGLEQRRRHY